MKTTGNTERDAMIREAIATVRANEPDAKLDVNILAAILPDDFQLGPDEVDLFASEPPIVDAEFKAVDHREVVGLIDLAPGGEAADTLSAEAELSPVGDSSPPVFTDPDKIDAAVEDVIRKADALSQANADLNVAQRRLGDATIRRGKAVLQFHSGFQPYTPKMLFRDNAIAGAAQRQAVKDGTAPGPVMPVPGPSVLDRGRAFARSLDAEGGGNSGRAVLMGGRGERIHPASAKGGRAKLPSQK